jgi:hypothetical protein
MTDSTGGLATEGSRIREVDLEEAVLIAHELSNKETFTSSANHAHFGLHDLYKHVYVVHSPFGKSLILSAGGKMTVPMTKRFALKAGLTCLFLFLFAFFFDVRPLLSYLSSVVGAEAQLISNAIVATFLVLAALMAYMAFREWRKASA